MYACLKAACGHGLGLMAEIATVLKVMGPTSRCHPNIQAANAGAVSTRVFIGESQKGR